MIADRLHKIVKNGKISIVGTLVSRQLPDSFNRIQVRAIRRQKIQPEDMTVFVQPRLELPGMMPTCVIYNNQHGPALSAVADKLRQECLERRGIECFLRPPDKASVLRAHRAKEGHALARGRMQEHGVHVFRRYPHGAS